MGKNLEKLQNCSANEMAAEV